MREKRFHDKGGNMNKNITQFQILSISILYLLLIGILIACSGNTPTPVLTLTPLPTSTQTASPQPTLTATQTSTPTATATFTPTTEPTQTPTLTPTFTPSPTPNIISIVSEQAVIYSGPGEAYDLLAVYAGGLKVYSMGRSDDNNWLLVNLPDRQGWIGTNNVNADFEIESLPVFEIPPTPIPSLTPTPSPNIVYYIQYLRQLRRKNLYINSMNTTQRGHLTKNLLK